MPRPYSKTELRQGRMTRMLPGQPAAVTAEEAEALLGLDDPDALPADPAKLQTPPAK